MNASKTHRLVFNRIAHIIPNIMLVGLLAVVVYTVIGSLLEHKTDDVYPKALGGKIDFSRVNFQTVDSVPLAGNWAFYWQTLLSYQDFNETAVLPEYTKVPHTWLDMPKYNNEVRKYGAATYRLNVTVPKHIDTLAINIPAIGSAYRLYINDTLISAGGEVSDNKERATPDYKSGLVSFSVPAQNFDIIVHVSNYDLIWGGMWEDLRIGDPAKVHIQQSIKNVRSAFLVAIFLTIAAFNLIQVALRSADATPLVIASICLLLATRELEASRLLAYMELYHFSYFASISISFATFYMATAMFLVYFYLSFPQEYNRKIVLSIVIISVIFTAAVFITPSTFFTQLTVYFQLLCIGLIAFMAYGVALAVKRKRQNATIVMLGTLILSILLVNDILFSLRIIDSINLLSFGLVGLVMCQNYATYNRFIIATKQNEFLSQELGERNTELESFSKSLEETVHKRTEDLSKANNQLEKLAYHDSLTAVLNRRGLLQLVDDAKLLLEKNKTPFCFLLIDFDHFKKLNDSFGHEAGDKVLVQGAHNIRSALSENDKVGRWGGEEFLILLNDTDLQTATKKAEGVRVVIDELMSARMGTRVTVSIGVSEFTPTESIEKAINRADEALYKAKAAGRNRVEVSHFETSIDP